MIDFTGRKPSYQNFDNSRKNYFDDHDMIRDQVNRIWAKHDANRSGALDKIETANFLRDYMSSQRLPAPSMETFRRFFAEFDSNRDGVISKMEMARFVKQYMVQSRMESPNKDMSPSKDAV
jgi:Ca2+-binding EF-hand superfamily protein